MAQNVCMFLHVKILKNGDTHSIYYMQTILYFTVHLKRLSKIMHLHNNNYNCSLHACELQLFPLYFYRRVNNALHLSAWRTQDTVRYTVWWCVHTYKMVDMLLGNLCFAFLMLMYIFAHDVVGTSLTTEASIHVLVVFYILCQWWPGMVFYKNTQFTCFWLAWLCLSFTNVLFLFPILFKSSLMREEGTV